MAARFITELQPTPEATGLAAPKSWTAQRLTITASPAGSTRSTTFISPTPTMAQILIFFTAKYPILIAMARSALVTNKPLNRVAPAKCILA